MMRNITTATTLTCFNQAATYVLMFLSFVATPLHFLIMKVLIVRFRLTLPRHKILLCLSLSDNLQIVGLGLFASIGLLLQPSVTSQTCQVMRQITEIVAVQANIASSGFILLLAVERYIACVFSLRFFLIFTSSRANFAVVSVWMISILCGLLALHPNEPNYSKTASNNARILLAYSVMVIVSSVSLIIIQAHLYRLSRTKFRVEPVIKFGTQREKDDLTKRQLKLGFAASIVIVLYLICMLPMACLFFYLLLNPEKDMAKMREAVSILTMLNMFVDPFVYGFGMADMRQGIKRQCIDWKRRICKE